MTYGRNASSKVSGIWKDCVISRYTKIRLPKKLIFLQLVFPIFINDVETWTVKAD